MTNDIGHYAALIARQESIRAFQASRGMSESALSRLPKSPPITKPIVPKTVLATKRDAIRYDLQTLASRPNSVSAAQFIQSVRGTLLEFGLRWTDEPAAPEDLRTAKMIVDVVADLAMHKPHQILAPGRGYRYNPARPVSIYLIASLTKLNLHCIGKLFNYADSSGAHYAIKRTRQLLQRGDRPTELFYQRALTAVKAKLREVA